MQLVKISDKDYFSKKAINSSLFKTYVLDSPTHFFYEYEGKLEYEKTKAMTFGSLVHCAILENEELKNRYAILPDECVGRSKAAIKAKEQFLQLNKDKELITKQELDDALAIAKKVNEIDEVKNLLNNTLKEQALFFKYSDIEFKAKFDAVNLEKNYIIDIKTCENASNGEFYRSSKYYGYDIQAFFYQFAYSFLEKKATILPDYYIVAIEKTDPFIVAIYKIELTEKKCDELNFKFCKMIDDLKNLNFKSYISDSLIF